MRTLRACLARFASGVSVVTVYPSTDASSGEPHGLTVNAFTSVSLNPPLVLVAIGRSTRGHALLDGRPFGINILSADQVLLARHFAGAFQPDLHVPWLEGALAPLLGGTLGYLECAPWRAYDGGDHTLYLGEVLHFDYRNGPGLGYFYGSFMQLDAPDMRLEYLVDE